MRKVSNQTAFLNAVKAPVKVVKARAYLPNLGIERLPDDYQEVSYIESTGTQYIDTGMKATPLTKTRVRYEFTQVDTKQQRVFGTQDGTGVWYSHYLNGGGCQACSFKDGGGNWIQVNSTVLTAGNIYEFELDGKNLTAQGWTGAGVSLGSKALQSGVATLTSTNNLMLLRESATTGNYARVKLYSVKIWENDVQVRDFVPCYRKVDNKAGLYDMVNGVFYTNNGTGEFTLGSDEKSNTVPMELTSDDNLVSWKLAQDSYFFNAVATQAQLIILGTNWGNLIGQRVDLFFSVQTGNTWQDVKCGRFEVSEQAVDIEREKTTLTLIDPIAKAQTEKYADVGTFAYPTTVKGIGTQTANQYGLEAKIQRQNLIKYSNTFRVGSVASNKIVQTITADGELQTAVQADNGNWNAGWWDSRNVWQYVEDQFEEGDKFTLVLTIKKSSANDTGKPIFYIKNGMGYYTLNGTVGTSYGELYYTGTWKKANNIALHLGWSNCVGTFTIKNFMIKKGDYSSYEPYIELPNVDYPITQDLWATINDTTMRDVLSQVAGATGSLIRASSDGETMDLVSTKFPTNALTLTYGEMKKWKLEDRYGKVNTVVLSRQPAEDNVVAEDLNMVNSAKDAYVLTKDGMATPFSDTTYWSGTSGTTQTLLEDGWCRFEGTDAQFNNFMMRKACVDGVEIGKTYTIIYELRNLVGGPTFTLTQQRNEECFNNFQVISSPNGLTGTITNFGVNTVEGTYVLKGTVIRDGSLFLRTFGGLRYNKSMEVRLTVLEGDHTNDWQNYPWKTYETAGNIAVKLGNNEILDDERETLAPPILESVKGLEFYTGEITTTGIGLFEAGDFIYVDDGVEAPYKFLVTAVDLTIDGSVKEVLKCIAPVEDDTNYAIAGSVYKSIWNTEIKVDKQGNQITSIVSRQDQTDEYIAEQFTRVDQNINNIVLSVQAGGGGNLIRNSVGYGKDGDGYLTSWTYGSGATTSNVTSQTSPSSLSNGAVSGNEIVITGTSINQTVNLTANEEYTLSAIVDKPIVGAVTISVTNSRDSFSITYPDQTASSWERKTLTFTPTESYVIVTITSASGTTARITDLMLASGTITTWRESSGEIYNTQVSVDREGMKVSSSQYAGDYVEITPLEFAGYSNVSGTKKKVFSLNRDITEVEKLKARSEIFMPPIKVLPINNSSYKGWAFVKQEN